MADQLGGSLQTALADLAKWLEEARIPATVVGGIAASILGRPRLTRDIDALALLDEAEWSRAIESAAHHGIVPRIDDALQFAHRGRVLLMQHVSSGIELDVIFGGLPFERSAVLKSAVHDVGGVRINVPSMPAMLEEFDKLVEQTRRGT